MGAGVGGGAGVRVHSRLRCVMQLGKHHNLTTSSGEGQNKAGR